VVGYLTGRLGLSHRDVVEAVEALHGLDLSLGSISSIQDHISKALEQPVKTAQQIDATPRVTVFRILAGRGQTQAKEVIGKGLTDNALSAAPTRHAERAGRKCLRQVSLQGDVDQASDRLPKPFVPGSILPQ
jgi:hypothetical protein